MSSFLKYFFSFINTIKLSFTKENLKIFFIKIKIAEKRIFLLEKKEKNSYYYVKNNVWPFLFSLALSLILLKIVFFLHDQSFFASTSTSILLILFLFFSGYGWFKNLNNESLYENEQTLSEKKNLVQGFLFFILIEFMTFAACFWVLFHSGLAPSIWIGALWPGEGIVCILVSEDVTIYANYNKTAHFFDNEPCTVNYNSHGFVLSDETPLNVQMYPDRFRVHINLFDKGQLINPYKVPLMNTFILLLSAATVTLSHKSLKLEKYFLSIILLFLTIVLGIIFVKIQYIEYKNSMISSDDGIYGSSFFAITGLHGLHVIIGVLFLLICLVTLIFKKYSSNLHRSFEFAIWYWHFVDVIWIFVYFLLYLWPASFFYKEEIFIWTISENYYCVNMSVDTYRDILYLNYLQEIKNKDNNLNWVAENLQNYNMNLIRRDIDHYHFFLEMTREYILVNVMLHRYFEKTKYESVFVFFLMMLYTIYNEWDLFLFVFFSVIIWFKSDSFDFVPFFQNSYSFFSKLLSLKKNERKQYLFNVLNDWKSDYVSLFNMYKEECFTKNFFLKELPLCFLDNAVSNNFPIIFSKLVEKLFNFKNYVFRKSLLFLNKLDKIITDYLSK